MKSTLILWVPVVYTGSSRHGNMPRLILCMLLLASSAWAGTFRDDFEDGNLDSWQKDQTTMLR
jgi:ABC-type transport system involved in cytochrome c biogenesis permease component